MKAATTHVLLLALLLLLPAAALGADAPHLLVGEWWGDWAFMGQRGKFYLTITKVDGSRVWGSVEAHHGSKIPAESFDDGVFEGSVLRIQTRQRHIELVLSDGVMNGTLRTSVQVELKELVKKK